jgi:predicted ATP-binding protein involved in virulence
MLAYGSTRLLPRGRHAPAPGKRFARLDNLFDPFVPLENATRWLIGLNRRDPAAFDQMAISLKRLLDLPDENELVADEGAERIMVKLHGADVSLEELSDGYQSVLALATDIMSVMLDKWASMSTAEGVVLLDEIGSHLHPRWRMRIVDALRDAFPSVQFVVTTHDPLCLRGLETGEVALMRRDSQGKIHAITELPAVKGLTVNQLLTSEHFGLSTTMDPKVEAVYERYRELLEKPRLSKKEREELEGHKRTLARYDQMGQTRRERLMLEAIDRHLAREESELGTVPAEEWNRKLQDELESILAADGEGA